MKTKLLFFYRSIGILVTLIVSTSTVAEKAPSEFHRLIIHNKEQQLLVVKIKGTDLWVTPGLYSESGSYDMDELFSLAGEYGLEIGTPKLKGVFQLQSKGADYLSNRHFFIARTSDTKIKLPDNIEAAKWLNKEKALEIINIPHITLLMKQILDHPTQVWTASVERLKDGNELQARLLSPFVVQTSN